MSKLQSKVAVITGGNSGIGLATAQSFVDAGARVVIFGRNPETLKEAVKQLGNGTLGVQGDVTLGEDLDRLFTSVKNAYGRIDILFVNAGVARFAPFEQTDEELFDTNFGVNIRGAYFTIQKALPLLGEGASVILNTSVTNQIGMPGSSSYAASKAALRSLARTLSAELLPRGIRVNAVSPGPISTPIYDRLGLPKEEVDAFGQQLLSELPLGRFGRPEELASAVTFLASTDSSYVVGAELVVDGGFTQI
ncbi:MAG: SDR family oxidoreductase [Acidobacteria bacterium]|nr:SDR family oxidoreductase [Acidobacteriota bacterium]